MFALIVTVHVPVPEQLPLQPANTVSFLTRAFNVTVTPLLKLVLHLLPQSMPAGLLVTVPLELLEPFLVTVRVNVVVTVNGNGFDADAPGFTTVTEAVPAVAMSLARIAAVS
jgi:hypothetical protein